MHGMCATRCLDVSSLCAQLAFERNNDQMILNFMFICLSMSNYDKRSDVNEVHDCGERMIVKRGERRARRVPCREAFQLSSNSILTLFLLITVMMVMYSVHII